MACYRWDVTTPVPVAARHANALAVGVLVEGTPQAFPTLPLVAVPVEFSSSTWSFRFAYPGRRAPTAADGSGEDGKPIAFTRGEPLRPSLLSVYRDASFDHATRTASKLVDALSVVDSPDSPTVLATSGLLASLPSRLGEARSLYQAGADPLREPSELALPAGLPLPHGPGCGRLEAALAAAPVTPVTSASLATTRAGPDLESAPDAIVLTPRALASLAAFDASPRPSSPATPGSACDPLVVLHVGDVVVLGDGPPRVRGVGTTIGPDGLARHLDGRRHAGVPRLPQSLRDLVRRALLEELEEGVYPPARLHLHHAGRRWTRLPSSETLVDEDDAERDDRLLAMAAALCRPVLAGDDPDALGRSSSPWALGGSLGGKDMWEYASPGRGAQSIRAYFAHAIGDPAGVADAPANWTRYVVAPATWLHEWSCRLQHDYLWLRASLPDAAFASDKVAALVGEDSGPAAPFAPALEALAPPRPGVRLGRLHDAGDVAHVATWREGVERAKVALLSGRRAAMAGRRLVRVLGPDALEEAPWSPSAWHPALEPSAERRVRAPRHDFTTDEPPKSKPRVATVADDAFFAFIGRARG